ncbi:hypothetical protein IGI04_008368 [Brassica rapa subsp. trilocularis]|uniref:Uncharacterized protein n=1 Tax=Brassica rapa subsp. trilocularis TaxID=1813537 RepID=A0ABQ7NQN7_BRACM|nr:hypothetical protein IGI04_008368 [Brassica rapa subsp. trilocularis]
MVITVSQVNYYRQYTLANISKGYVSNWLTCNFSLLAISALRLLYLQTSSSSGDRRVAALLAPPPVRSVVDSLVLCSALFSFLFDGDMVVEELESLRLRVVCHIYLGSVCVAAAVSRRGGDPRVVRSCRVIKSGFVGVERSALSLVSSEVEVIVRWAVSDNDKSRSDAPEVVGLMQAWCARFILLQCGFKLPVHGL